MSHFKRALASVLVATTLTAPSVQAQEFFQSPPTTSDGYLMLTPDDPAFWDFDTTAYRVITPWGHGRISCSYGEGCVQFDAAGQAHKVRAVLNPFHTENHTMPHFYFEPNHPGINLAVSLQSLCYARVDCHMVEKLSRSIYVGWKNNPVLWNALLPVIKNLADSYAHMNRMSSKSSGPVINFTALLLYPFVWLSSLTN